MITFESYKEQFDNILEGKSFDTIYENPTFLNYVKLNASRMKRWEKTGKLDDETVQVVKNIAQPQKWVIITEPWCGDAAQIVPFIQKMASENKNIELVIQNRDNGSEIDHYLTNGGKSIPKLIVRDELGKDLFNWGPRPAPAQKLHFDLKEDSTLSAEEKKEKLQQWYNQDKGQLIQKEISDLLKDI